MSLSPRRIDQVTVAGSRQATTVVLPWASRSALLVRLRQEPDTQEVVRQFEAMGTSAPVKLDPAGKTRLLESVSRWLDEVGVDGLPEALFELRNALEDERAYGELD